MKDETGALDFSLPECCVLNVEIQTGRKNSQQHYNDIMARYLKLKVIFSYKNIIHKIFMLHIFLHATRDEHTCSGRGRGYTRVSQII
jgi:hypothetical protein